jgi:hypothetical protein
VVSAWDAAWSASLPAGGASIRENDILEVSSIGWNTIRAIKDPDGGIRIF